jgi:hypothetical protein
LLSISQHYLAQGEGRQGGSVPSPCLKHIPTPLIRVCYSFQLQAKETYFTDGFFGILLTTLFKTASSVVAQIPLCRGDAGIELRTGLTLPLEVYLPRNKYKCTSAQDK